MKKKILFMLPNLNYGGAENVTINFFNYLDQKKYDKELLIQGSKGPLSKRILNKNKVIYYNSKRFITFLFFFVKYLKKNKYDYIYSTLSHVSMFLLILKIFGILESKLIIRESNFIKNIINSSKIKYLLLIYYKYLYKKVDKVIASSKTIQKDIINITQVEKRKTIIIYNPLEKVFFKTKFKKSNLKKIKFLSIGRLSIQKDYENLLILLSKINNSKWKLRIIGDGKKKQIIKNLIKKLNLTSNVKIISKSSQVWKEIMKCDFYINSSKWEGMPNAVIESLVMKKKIFFINKIEVFLELKKLFPEQIFYLKKNFSFSEKKFSSLNNINNKNIQLFSIEKNINKFESILK
tara:strand:- start:571 stop:1617 length:1047 start_codon:yes stop_codon:yes gene_type:complete